MSTDMYGTRTETHDNWVESLPYSKMVRPDSLLDLCKYAFWKLFAPLHPYARDIAMSLGIVHFDQFLDAKGRQKFLLGVIASEYTAQQLVEYLVAQGFGNHFIAWKDNGEIASLRLADGFTHQYHVRVFDDGEVRAHYELTPEAYPLKHYYEIGMEERREYFIGLIGHMLQ